MISQTKVVTAAHCVLNKGESKPVNHYELTVLLGAHDITNLLEPETRRELVEKIVIHHSWNPSNVKFTGDIAVLILSNIITSTDYIKPICLSEDLDDETEGIVSGWGKTETGRISDAPKQIKIPILQKSDCYEEEFKLGISGWSESLCAGRQNVSVCQGDSGSGLVVKNGNKFYLRGVVSNAVTSEICAEKHLAIYSDVTQYIPFITENDDDHESKETTVVTTPKTTTRTIQKAPQRTTAKVTTKTTKRTTAKFTATTMQTTTKASTSTKRPETLSEFTFDLHEIHIFSPR